jgi:hypothetical protein
MRTVIELFQTFVPVTPVPKRLFLLHHPSASGLNTQCDHVSCFRGEWTEVSSSQGSAFEPFWWKLNSVHSEETKLKKKEKVKRGDTLFVSTHFQLIYVTGLFMGYMFSSALMGPTPKPIWNKMKQLLKCAVRRNESKYGAEVKEAFEMGWQGWREASVHGW